MPSKEEHWLSLKEVATACDVSVRTLFNWRKDGCAPPLFKLGKRWRGWPTEIRIWIERQRR
jgi:predicted DNA-binding transcriptional regulator AlpA